MLLLVDWSCVGRTMEEKTPGTFQALHSVEIEMSDLRFKPI